MGRPNDETDTVVTTLSPGSLAPLFRGAGNLQKDRICISSTLLEFRTTGIGSSGENIEPPSSLPHPFKEWLKGITPQIGIDGTSSSPARSPSTGSRSPSCSGPLTRAAAQTRPRPAASRKQHKSLPRYYSLYRS